MLRAMILEDANSSHEPTVGKPVPMRDCAPWHEKTAWNEHANFIGKLEVFVSIKFRVQISFQCALKRYCGEMFGEKLILSCLMGKMWAGYRSVLKSVTTPGVTLIQLQVSYTIWGGAVSLATGASCRLPPAPPKSCAWPWSQQGKTQECMPVCIAPPVPSRVSSDRVVPPQTIARKTLQDMTNTFPPKAGMSTLAPLCNRIGKTDPHARGSHVLCLFNSASPPSGRLDPEFSQWTRDLR